MTRSEQVDRASLVDYILYFYIHGSERRPIEGQVVNLAQRTGLIENDIEASHRASAAVSKLTDKGKKWAELLLETPFPALRWVDPR